MRNAEKSMLQAVRESGLVDVPAHIAACASACRYDLLYGPSFARIPPAGIEAFTVDDYATFRADLEDSEGEITETYVGPIGDALREFIDSLPSQLFYDPDCEDVMTSEPEGEYLDGETLEPCDSDAEGAQYFEPSEYYELGRHEIVQALFGETIAKEFR